MDEQLYRKALEDCRVQAAALTGFIGLTIELRGVWLWISGKTKQHHIALKALGFSFSGPKQEWYWCPDYVKYKKFDVDMTPKFYITGGIYDSN